MDPWFPAPDLGCGGPTAMAAAFVGMSGSFSSVCSSGRPNPRALGLGLVSREETSSPRRGATAVGQICPWDQTWRLGGHLFGRARAPARYSTS